MTTLHAGWIAAPAVGAYMGDVRRVRVFYDGVELGALDPRGRGVLDLTQINLWSVEDAVDRAHGATKCASICEAGACRNTTPDTRTDVATGDQQTNLYRGFFGKRLDNGVAHSVRRAAVRYDAAVRVRNEQRSDSESSAASVGRSVTGASTDSPRASAGIAERSSVKRATGSSGRRVAIRFRPSNRPGATPTFASHTAIPTRVPSGRRSWPRARSTATRESVPFQRPAS